MGLNLERFDDFINSCIFMHDDTDSDAGVDWDQHGTNPFLLRPKYCIIESLDGFGDQYLEYLQLIKALPETIICPSEHNGSLTNKILNDIESLNTIKKLCNSGMDISPFYSDDEKKNLLEIINKDTFVKTKIHPPHDLFNAVNDKLNVWKLMREKNIPLPIGMICESVNDLIYFYDQVSSRYSSILIKRKHWDTIRVENKQDIDKYSDKIIFPVIAEVAYKIKCSPISHNLIWNGEKSHLFIVMQDIKNWKHAGNYIPTGLNSHEKEKILEISNEFLDLLPNYSGVIGIDFVLTADEEVIPVDINPRFNSSTYPFYYLKRAGMDFNKIRARYRFIKCNIPNLSYVLRNKNFVPFSPEISEGIILYCPAYSKQTGRVIKTSYLCVGKNEQQVIELEKHLFLALKEIESRLNG